MQVKIIFKIQIYRNKIILYYYKLIINMQIKLLKSQKQKLSVNL